MSAKQTNAALQLSICRCQLRGQACLLLTDSRQQRLLCLLVYRRRSLSTVVDQGTPFANLRPIRFGSDWRAFHVHLRQCLLGFQWFKDMFCLIVLDCIWWAEYQSMSPASSAWHSTSTLRDGCLSGKLFACHCVDHRPCPHRCSSGQRRPYSYTALTVASQHFRRFPFARRRRLRCCSDSVCDTLTGQGVVGAGRAPCSRPRRAGGTWADAARGGAGEARWEAHQSIPSPSRRSTVAPFFNLQPSLRARSSSPRGPFIPTPGGSTIPCQAVEPAILTPAVPAPQRHQGVLMAAPATPAVRPLQWVTRAILRLLLRCLTPAQTVLVCLCCPTSSASERLLSGPSPPSPLHHAATVAAPRRNSTYSTQYSNWILRYSIQLTLAGPKPAAESAHHKTLQFRYRQSRTYTLGLLARESPLAGSDPLPSLFVTHYPPSTPYPPPPHPS